MASEQEQHSPFGSWKSPITAELVSTSGVRLSQTTVDGKHIFWLEGRPAEGGRQVIVRFDEASGIEDVLPAPFNARTLVHEYGGGAFAVRDGLIIFANFDDQRLYQCRPGEAPAAVTQLPAQPGAHRYADIDFDPARNRVVCVREDHSHPHAEAVNTLVEIMLDAGENGIHEERVLVNGSDFYSNPRFSHDGKRLCWLSWNHPNMPWDASELWVGEFDADGHMWRAIKVAGGKDESICQPEWMDNGSLCFISDRTGFWNLYVLKDPEGTGEALPVAPKANDFGTPQWVFGMSTYRPVASDRIICAFSKNGVWQLSWLKLNWRSTKLEQFQLEEIDSSFTDFSYVTGNERHIAMIAGSPTTSPAVVVFDREKESFKTIKSSTNLVVEPGYVSEPEAITFPTANDRHAHAFYYPPRNRDYQIPASELPPLLVKSHGGPTGSASSTLNLSIQYWTSRGFAVVDVNYGGSSGFGREFRERLKGNWGIVDVEDCENAALYLAGEGKVDGRRLAITGGSAGGYTTLCALTFCDTFKAGASHFGVSDLEALAADTHKFESRYGDGLVGPYPGAKETYQLRSPINHTDKLTCPIIFFQGLEDKVVLPNQAEKMVEALRQKHLPVAYIAYPGEQHGFRKSENIKRTLEAEFYFYSRIFGFTPADQIEPVEVENMDELSAV